MKRSKCVELRASVVVPVYNRPDELRRLLAGLIQQTMEPADFEIVICDDGSKADIASVVAEFQKEIGLEIRYFRQSHQGTGAARNLGLANAQSDIVAFTNSDCLVDQNWLERLIDSVCPSSKFITIPIKSTAATRSPGNLSNHRVSSPPAEIRSLKPCGKWA